MSFIPEPLCSEEDVDIARDEDNGGDLNESESIMINV
jgi:hypothetical protein